MTGIFDSDYTYDSRNPPKPRSSPATMLSVRRELIAKKKNSLNPIQKNQPVGISDGLGPNVILPCGRRLNVCSVSSPVKIIQRNQSLNPAKQSPRGPNIVCPSQLARPICQTRRARKSVRQLEKECDDDDEDVVPEDCFLENVPISPRPQSQNSRRAPKPTSTIQGKSSKLKCKPLGNGTSAQPTEQGELRSPRPITAGSGSTKPVQVIHDHFNIRDTSWSRAISQLSKETKDLTEALEEYESENLQAGSIYRRPLDRSRVKSASADLPPLRKTEMMIDPFPISKEKEAFLSRTRPSWLPPKDPAEEKRHLKEYKKMMARSLETDRKKEQQKLGRTESHDDTSDYLLQMWEEHVLSNWEVALRQKRTKELWWKGIPPKIRGKVWKRAIGNELELSEKSYTAALRRVQQIEATIQSGSELSYEERLKKVWLDRINDDVKNTYPELRIFQPDGPLHTSIVNVLKAYTMYRSDVGYVGGTSTSAALLLLNLPTPCDAFIALSNLLNRPLPLAFYTYELGAMRQTSLLLFSTLERKSLKLHSHLSSLNVINTPEKLFRELFTSMGTAHMSLDNATRLWDIMIFERDSILIRAAVACLTNMESKLLGAVSFQQVSDIIQKQFLNIEEENWVDSLRETGAEPSN